MGFDEDLNEAMKIAVRGTIDFLANRKWYQCPARKLNALTSSSGLPASLRW